MSITIFDIFTCVVITCWQAAVPVAAVIAAAVV